MLCSMLNAEVSLAGSQPSNTWTGAQSTADTCCSWDAWMGCLTRHGVCADAEDEGGEEEAEEDREEGAQKLQEAFLGEASVPMSAAQVQRSKVFYVTGSFPSHHCRATDATSKAITSPVYP